MSRIDFVVCGRAIPQGGLRIIPLPDGKRILAPNNSAKLNPWRKKVREAAKAAMRDAAWEMFGPEIPLCAQLQFCFLRPKSTDRRFPTVKPDIDKLERAILDSLTGIVWTDDAQVVRVTKAKHYGEFQRVEIRVERMG